MGERGRGDIFQYLQSDRALCNANLCHASTATAILSVSPIGSSPLQLPTKCRATAQYYHFQYPQSDRALCNLRVAEPEQQRALSFSIPNRIEPSATLPILSASTPQMESFSIPNRIEPSATIVLPFAVRAGRNFQYPQSDRALCNRGAGTWRW